MIIVDIDIPNGSMIMSIIVFLVLIAAAVVVSVAASFGQILFAMRISSSCEKATSFWTTRIRRPNSKTDRNLIMMGSARAMVPSNSCAYGNMSEQQGVNDPAIVLVSFFALVASSFSTLLLLNLLL